jgi:flagellar biosynthetic protein FlhB
MAEDLGEKTEQPTAKKKIEARQNGQLGKSSDLAGALVLCGAALGLAIFGLGMFETMTQLMRHTLASNSLADGITVPSLSLTVGLTIREVGMAIVPLMVLMVLVAALSQLLQIGLLLTDKPLQPNLKRLNVIKGVQKLFSKRTLVKSVIDSMKVALLASVIYIAVHMEYEELIALAMLSTTAAVAEALRLMAKVTILVLLVLLILGLIDWAYQRWQQNEDLKMTKQEVKDERKSSEGDMETKQRRMGMARRIAMQRLQADVPNADVVVTNPTHFAVALRYDQETMDAPKVIAKGADLLAMRIRQLAVMHGIPIVERPPLARALYAECEVGQTINPDHFEAVAEVLAYVYRLEGRAAS